MRPAPLNHRLARSLLALLAVAALSCSRDGTNGDLLDGIRGVPSSEWATCSPEQQRCAGTVTGIEFHTHDELRPFVEYDIGRKARVSRVEVHNRRDGGLGARAVPLLVLTSPDGQQWQQVARRDEVFDVWTASFPATEARYLKLQVDRHSVLHLERVRAWE